MRCKSRYEQHHKRKKSQKSYSSLAVRHNSLSDFAENGSVHPYNYHQAEHSEKSENFNKHIMSLNTAVAFKGASQEKQTHITAENVKIMHPEVEAAV